MTASDSNVGRSVPRTTSEPVSGRSDGLSTPGDGQAPNSPTVTVLTDAEAVEMRRLHRTRSIECGALTTHLMCSGCDGKAMDGGGLCLHDCHRCQSRIAHEDGAVRRCELDPHPADVLHEAGDVRWSDGNEQVVGGAGRVSLDDLTVRYGREDLDEARTETAAKIALEIRRELVCCDVYDRLASLRARMEASADGGIEVSAELDDAIGGHDACYWGEAGARIAESVGRGDRG